MADTTAMFQAIDQLAIEAHQIATDRGWHDPRDIEGTTRDASAAERVALIHEECTELLREIRKGAPASFWIEVDGKPEGAAAEVADIIIRALDYAAHYGIQLGPVIAHKMAYNRQRPERHGGMVL